MVMGQLWDREGYHGIVKTNAFGCCVEPVTQEEFTREQVGTGSGQIVTRAAVSIIFTTRSFGRKKLK
jgi:hypothetical protein